MLCILILLHTDKVKGPKDQANQKIASGNKPWENDAEFQKSLHEKRMAKFQGLQAESIDGEGWMIGRVNYEAEYQAYKNQQEKAKSSIKKQK